MLRRRWVAAVVASAVLAGAGASVPAGAATLADQSITTTTANPATDRATAQAINLTAADLPGWQETPNSGGSSNKGLDNQLAACVGGRNPASSKVVEVESPDFDKGAVEVSSDVTMVKSHADGLADLRLLKSPKLASCAERALSSTLASALPKGAHISNLKVSSFKPTESLPDSFGLRFGLTISGKSQGITISVPLTVTEIGFLVGRAEVGLSEAQKGKPSAGAPEEALIHAMLGRAGGPVTA